MTTRIDVPTRWSASTRLLATLAVVGFVGAAACEQPIPEAVEVVRPVKMLELDGGGASASFEYPAQIAATTDAEIAFEVSGLITEFPVDQGQFVQAGDLLAQIDPRDFEAQLDAVRAQRNVAYADYQRYQDLYAADAASLQELEVSRRQFEVSDARIRTAEKALADTTLRAPFSGQVARKMVEEFQSVSARQPILVLQDVVETLDVIVNVPENDLTFRPEEAVGDLDAAVRLTAELTGYPGERIPLRIKEFASQADPITRTFEVTFSFSPPERFRILPGMTATVFVDPLEETGTFSVPAQAIVSNEGGEPFVWVVDRSAMTVSRRSVRLGDLVGAEAQVVEGLSSGDVIAVSAAQNLRDGMEVREIQY